jgi:formylglycine-generating enzyme required for sulfatase activity
MRRSIFLVAVLAAGCGNAGPMPSVVAVPAGEFIMGSGASEREAAYRLDEQAYGHSVTRRQGWYDRELPSQRVGTQAYGIMTRPVTNAQYARFVAASGHPAPDVDEATWAAYGLVHPFARTRRHAWRDGAPPPGRGDHPVVLVSHADAEAYAAWLAKQTGVAWRLPSEPEWEKAARGVDGWRFPWGDRFEPDRLNSHDKGPFDTTQAGELAAGASPFGMLDAAGQVYEWTATAAGPARYIVKGGSWDDKGCGVCRPAARHSRPAEIRHILIGFRLVRPPVGQR